MYLSKLRLLSFRIYPQIEIDLYPGVNLVLGQNGQGKTSLLEAMSTLALTRSPRTGLLGECASWGEQHFGVWAQLHDSHGDVPIELRGDRQPGSERWNRKLRLGGASVLPRNLLGRLRVVLFWPEDLSLVKGGPEPRRRLLDTVLSQLSPSYAEDAIRYRRALEHRNHLLQRIRGEGMPRLELRPWTEALVDHGSRIVAERRRYLRAIEPLARAAVASIGEPLDLRIEYRPALGRSSSAGAEESSEEALRLALASMEGEEIQRAQTLCGPHRDDFEISLGGQPARQFASQGQQRTIVLALKVAEVRQHLVVSGEAPVLLLDDVLSELDRGRRAGLISLLGGELGVEQTIISSAEDPDIGGEVVVAQILEVDSGRVTARRLDPGMAR